MQDLVDIAAVSRLAHAAGAMVIVDNVFATPVLSRPLDFGADVVVYSATKHIDGQGRVLGGAILGTDEYIHGPVQTLIRNTGPSLSAFNAWVLLKGLETLSLRVRAPDRVGPAGRDVARAAARRLAASATRTCRRTRSTRSPSRSRPAAAPSSRSTSPCPTARRPTSPRRSRSACSTRCGSSTSRTTSATPSRSSRTPRRRRTASSVPRDARPWASRESTVRLSVGLEDPADLIDDLAQALGTLAG